MMTRMKLGKIAILLLVQLMCCCGKPDTGIIITPPNPKPDSGQQGGGNGSGSGSGGGSGSNSGKKDSTPKTGDDFPLGLTLTGIFLSMGAIIIAVTKLRKR